MIAKPRAFAMGASADELAIARSVIYASLFDYPLTLNQLHQTLIESPQTPAAIFATYRSSAFLHDIIEYRDGFFFPAGRAGLIAERRRRRARSQAFLAHHRRLLRLVCAVPYTRLVALSGSIAHLNLEGDGDLDLFIVTRGPHVWSVTVAVLLLAKLMRRRRILCANFVLADSHLALDQPDLFTASQIIHLKPLVGEELFAGFLAANPFVARFYPNFSPRPLREGGRTKPPGRLKASIEWMLRPLSPLLEAACRRAYGWHLRRRSTSWRSPDQVRLQPDYLKLHTRSHRQDTLDRFEREVRGALEGAAERLAIAAMPASHRR